MTMHTTKKNTKNPGPKKKDEKAKLNKINKRALKQIKGTEGWTKKIRHSLKDLLGGNEGLLATAIPSPGEDSLRYQVVIFAGDYSNPVALIDPVMGRLDLSKGYPAREFQPIVKICSKKGRGRKEY